ncbi:MAG TPA: hypothetical protein VGG25_27710 [Streptosporangiaceae bacterium]|jgi:predicted ATP-grasp superfamily ATP-dependent carboligase
MTRPRLILLGVTRHTVEEAVRLGARVVVIDTPAFISILDPPEGTTAIADAGYLARSPESIVAMARAALGGADACLTLTEVAMALSAEVNAVLGVPDNSPDAVAATIDKAVMRARLAAAPELGTEWARAGDPRAFTEFLAGRDGSWIAKPVAGSGSIGVARCHDGAPAPAGGYPYLIERELSGTEFSVESFSQDGQHSVIGCTTSEPGPRGAPDEFAQYGHLFPMAADPAQAAAVRRAVGLLLDTLGVRQGLTHTEIMLTAEGPRVIETHVRHGGGKILDLVHAALGIDMVRLAVAARLGHDPAAYLEPGWQRVAAVRFFQVRPGTVTRYAGVARAARIPGVIRLEFPWHLGDRISRQDAVTHRPGYVLVAAGTQQEAERALDAVEAEIEWSVRP